MVQTDISQISGECNTWREKLRNLREEFTQDEARLRQVAGQSLSKEQLLDVEHLHNQFHIQLINIHDLKQSIKNHDRQVSFELAGNNSVTDANLTKHEELHSELELLEQTLDELRAEFKHFLQRTS
jgi:hypothetical protein